MSLRERRNSFSTKIFETGRAVRRFSLLLGKDRLSGVVYESPKESISESADNKVFGVELKTAVMRSNKSHHMLPDVAYKCLVYLEQKGVTEEGIFRLSGSATDIQKMREQFDLGQDYDVRSCLNPHTVAGVLKLFLRELPVPLLIADATEVSDVLEYTKSIVESAPQENRYLMGCLFKLLHKVSEQEGVTKMGVKNLVIVFSAALQCSGTVITTLIKHATHIFPDNLLEKTVKIDTIAENNKIAINQLLSEKEVKKSNMFGDEDDIFGMEDDFEPTKKKTDLDQSSVALVQDLCKSPAFKKKWKSQKSIFDSDDEDSGSGW